MRDMDSPPLQIFSAAQQDRDRGTEVLGNVTPGPLTIDPITGESNDLVVEKSPSKIERKLDPEDEGLPGGIQWASKLSHAAEKRYDQIKLWGTTLSARANSTTESMNAARARMHESTMTKRANDFSFREAQHTQALTRLEGRSGIWNLPIARSITNTQVAYHTWRERVNQRKGTRADVRAERASNKATTAEKQQAYYDGNIAARVDKVAEKWQLKLDAIRTPHERIEARITELGDSISEKEALLAKILVRVTELENTTGGDRTKRREVLRGLYKSLTNETTALEIDRRKFNRAHKHRIRYTVGRDKSESVITSFRSRYEDHESWKSPDQSADSTPVNEQPSESEGESWGSLRELAERESDITNKQAGLIWNKTFSNAKLPEGFKTLAAMTKEAFPERNVLDAPDSKMSIKDFLNGLRELFDKSPDFKQLVEHASGRKRNSIDNVIERLETRIVLTDINDL